MFFNMLFTFNIFAYISLLIIIFNIKITMHIRATLKLESLSYSSFYFVINLQK